MSEWDTLARGWDYDLWANTQWLKTLEAKGCPEPDFGIFKHVLAASKIWVLRCNGSSSDKMPEVEPTVEAMLALRDEWKEVMGQVIDDPIIHFKRTTGEAMSLRFSEIMRHAQNHGTYHRGELRGLCRSRGDEDFPETDRGRFSFQFPI